MADIVHTPKIFHTFLSGQPFLQQDRGLSSPYPGPLSSTTQRCAGLETVALWAQSKLCTACSSVRLQTTLAVRMTADNGKWGMTEWRVASKQEECSAEKKKKSFFFAAGNRTILKCCVFIGGKIGTMIKPLTQNRSSLAFATNREHEVRGSTSLLLLAGCVYRVMPCV